MMANELTINPKTIYSELQKFKVQMEAALPRHMTPDRMARIALTQLRINKKLFECTAESFYASLMAASQLGLEPGVQGQCYLIPYGKVCTLVPGWRGYMDLVGRTERAAAWTDAVYDGDEFDYEKGDKPFIHHKPGKWAGKEAALIFTYAVGRIKASEWPVIEVWDIDKVWAHRNKQNKVGDRHYSYAYPEMYARKIPLLQVIKYLPSSIELANASALDVTASEGRQALTIDMALKGDLESGGDASEFDPNDPNEQELEELFDKLGKNATERKMLRESYIPQGRRNELLEYLRGRLAPTGQTVAKTETKATEKPAEQANQQASQAEVKTEQASTEMQQETPAKRRGRPTREETAAKEAAQRAAEQKTESQPKNIDQAAQDEKPAQQAEPGRPKTLNLEF
jgi:phage RecT family recombinase